MTQCGKDGLPAVSSLLTTALDKGTHPPCPWNISQCFSKPAGTQIRRWAPLCHGDKATIQRWGSHKLEGAWAPEVFEEQDCHYSANFMWLKKNMYLVHVLFEISVIHTLPLDKKSKTGRNKEQLCLFPVGFLMNKWETRPNWRNFPGGPVGFHWGKKFNPCSGN